MMIGFRVAAEVLAEIDRVRGSTSRSDFIRMATYKALKEAGSTLPESAILPPDRTGKGGRPRKSSAPPPR